jgi:hypothetical protein
MDESQINQSDQDDLSSAIVVCPKCGREHPANTQICTCGQLLADVQNLVATRALDDTDVEDVDDSFGSAQFTMRTRLVLGIEDNKRALVFDASDINQLTLGRSDPQTGFLPEVNLTPYNALEKGVSRKHAAIVHANRYLRLVDLHSPNGTFVNGNQVDPDRPRVLRDGDEVRLGHLYITITFERNR